MARQKVAVEQPAEKSGERAKRNERLVRMVRTGVEGQPDGEIFVKEMHVAQREYQGFKRAK